MEGTPGCCSSWRRQRGRWSTFFFLGLHNAEVIAEPISNDHFVQCFYKHFIRIWWQLDYFMSWRSGLLGTSSKPSMMTLHFVTPSAKKRQNVPFFCFRLHDEGVILSQNGQIKPEQRTTILSYVYQRVISCIFFCFSLTHIDSINTVKLLLEQISRNVWFERYCPVISWKSNEESKWPFPAMFVTFWRCFIQFRHSNSVLLAYLTLCGFYVSCFYILYFLIIIHCFSDPKMILRLAHTKQWKMYERSLDVS